MMCCTTRGRQLKMLYVFASRHKKVKVCYKFTCCIFAITHIRCPCFLSHVSPLAERNLTLQGLAASLGNLSYGKPLQKKILFISCSIEMWGHQFQTVQTLAKEIEHRSLSMHLSLSFPLHENWNRTIFSLWNDSVTQMQAQSTHLTKSSTYFVVGWRANFFTSHDVSSTELGTNELPINKLKITVIWTRRAHN